MIPASHSEDLSGLADGSGEFRMFDQDACVELDGATSGSPAPCAAGADLVLEDEHQFGEFEVTLTEPAPPAPPRNPDSPT